MESLKQFFSFMNDVDFQYVVLRNWDQLPYDVVLGEHSDLDLLVYDFEHWKELFPKAIAEYEYPRVRMKVPVGNSYVYCDIRHIGDDYYPEDFEKAILETKELNNRGFWTPNPIHHRLALAYHAVHHKNFVSRDYKRHLGEVEVSDLLEALKVSEIGWITPQDKSVGAFNGYWKGATSIVKKKDGRIVKTQVGYRSYPLIRNEYEILAKCYSDHFPQVFECSGDTLTMEDCGVPILENVPDNWKFQLDEIILHLKEYGVIHRDIKIDNLMVKDGVIKLIDFGWAKFVEEEDAKEVPSCLGFPNKPSYGFDDNFSMRSVKKQIEFELEEKSVLA